MKTNAPGAVSSLVCGIISVVLCWLPLAGLILGIVAIVHSRKAKAGINSRPDAYEGGGMAVGGLVCGIVGTVTSSLYNIVWLIGLIAVGAAVQQGSSY
jgi:hypothetical protein